MYKHIYKLLFVLLFLLLADLRADSFINVGTGNPSGLYYKTIEYICNYINKNKNIKTYVKKCSADPSSGSVFNLIAMKHKNINFAMVQGDIAYDAYNGINEYKDKVHTHLRAIAAIYTEVFTIVASNKSNIKKFTDLKGKNFNIGAPGSGDQVTFLALMNQYKINNKISINDINNLKFLAVNDIPAALKNGEIDGYALVVGSPSTIIEKSSKMTNIKIVQISKEVLNGITKKYPYYVKITIPARTYKGVDKPISTIGVKALLVVNDTVPDKVVYEITKTIVKNLETFKKLNPSYSNITVKSLTKNLGIPMANGAKKYFKEINAIQ